jgi:hypothetical protein
VSLLDSSETVAFEFAKSQGFVPRKTGPNEYRAHLQDDAAVVVLAPTPGEFIRAVAAASKRRPKK